MEKYSLNRISYSAESYALKEEKKRLICQNEATSELLTTEFRLITEDVAMLRDIYSSFLEHPERYKERVLPNSVYEDVKSAIPYVHYSQRFLKNGLTPKLDKEIKLVSNIADILPFFSDYYKSVFFGSESGYSVVIEVMDHPDDLVPESTEPFRSSYDPIYRSWYQKGKNLDGPGFSDVYLSQYGKMAVSCIAPYFVKGKFQGVLGVDFTSDKIYERVKSINANEDELYFILSNNGEILFVNFDSDAIKVKLNEDLRNSKEKSLSEIAKKMVSQKKGFDTLTIKGKDYFIAYSPVSNIKWSFASLVPVEKVYIPAEEVKSHLLSIKEGYSQKIQKSVITIVLSTFVFVFILLFFLFRQIVSLSERVVNPILSLARDVNEFASGNLDKRVEIYSQDEIQNIAENFNSFAQKLQCTIRDLNNLSDQKKRLDAEVNVVKEILLNYLPDNFSIADKQGYDLFAKEYPAKVSGSDFFDFYKLDEEHLIVSIGELSGRGVSYALFMMTTKTIVKSYCKLNFGQDLGWILERINKRLTEHNTEQISVSIFIGIIELSSGKMCYVNAGHCAPYIYRAENHRGSFLNDSSIDSKLALNVNASFCTHETILNPGDLLYMYTDGFTSEISTNGEKYNETMLEEAVINACEANQKSKDIVSSSYQTAVDFIGRDEFQDDITFLCLKRKN